MSAISTMPIEPKTIRDTMFERPDPVMFRSAAVILTAVVAGTNLWLGGSWRGFLVAILLVAVSCFILPANDPIDSARRGISVGIYRVKSWPGWVRICCAMIMVAGIAVLDFMAHGLELGREFNLFLLPIFLSSLLFGLPVAILTWFISFLTTYFCLIPPKYSFEISSLKDFAGLLGYVYLGLATLAIPALIRASSSAAQHKHPPGH